MIRTIGILGGGQLGRMLTLEAKRMGYRVVTLEPSTDSPAGQLADEQLVAAYDDLRFIGELGARAERLEVARSGALGIARHSRSLNVVPPRLR